MAHKSKNHSSEKVAINNFCIKYRIQKYSKSTIKNQHSLIEIRHSIYLANTSEPKKYWLTGIRQVFKTYMF
ncbi:MAG: hypothetical protein DRJ01_10705 [Bacteroidetes bacterium]|nr:MAG: hypothetical protein DRJ01_10705 [Bacteroidota bacterium]